MSKSNKLYIAKCPLRISLFGGSTDYPSYFEKYEASVIGFSIDKYSYVMIRHTPDIFDYRTRIQYAKVEEVNDNTEIQHPGVRGALEFLQDGGGYEISHMGCLPARTGTGSSSSFVVALLAGLHAANGRMRTSIELAEEANKIEREVLQEPGGLQDAYWCTGGINRIDFNKNGVNINKIFLPCDFKEELLSRCALLYTGKTRQSFDIAASHDNAAALSHKHEIKGLALDAYGAFKDQDIDRLATLLDKSWDAKKRISPLVSNELIDGYCDLGKRNGALSMKLDSIGLKNIEFGIDYEGVKVI
jgi:D-glycero-alpha-D-manno-heptose-7-phosphate kinase